MLRQRNLGSPVAGDQYRYLSAVLKISVQPPAMFSELFSSTLSEAAMLCISQHTSICQFDDVGSRGEV